MSCYGTELLAYFCFVDFCCWNLQLSSQSIWFSVYVLKVFVFVCLLQLDTKGFSLMVPRWWGRTLTSHAALHAVQGCCIPGVTSTLLGTATLLTFTPIHAKEGLCMPLYRVILIPVWGRTSILNHTTSTGGKNKNCCFVPRELETVRYSFHSSFQLNPVPNIFLWKSDSVMIMFSDSLK